MAGRRALLPILLSDSDASLARRAGAGDEAAFEVLVRRHGDALGRYCRAVLRQQQDAEDALQATLLCAYRSLSRMDRPDSVRPWLLRIARNECMRVAAARAGTEPLGAEPPVEARLPERVQARDELRVLGADLRALPEHQRAAMVLREICGLSSRQAAQVIGVTPDAVRRLVHDARRSLVSFGAGRDLACADVLQLIAAGDGRVMRARSVGAHLRGCAGCRAAQSARRPLGALLPPLPAWLAGRWLAAKVAAGTVAGAVVVSGALVVAGLDHPRAGTAQAAAAERPAQVAAAPPSGAAARDAGVRRSDPVAAPGRPVGAIAPSGPAPAPAGGWTPAPPAPAPPAGPGADPAPAAPAQPGPATPPPAASATAAPAGTTITGGPAPAPAPTAPAPAAVSPATTAPVVAATVSTPVASAAVSVGTGGVSAGARVSTPALAPVLAPVTATAQVSVEPAPGRILPAVGATVDLGPGLPPVGIALP